MKEQAKWAWGYAGTKWTESLWINYRIKVDTWRELWARQEGRCAGCKEEFAHPFEKAMKMGVKSQIDHKHIEGQHCEAEDVRGLLCGRCNNFLGKIQDNREVLTNLLAYLKAHGD